MCQYRLISHCPRHKFDRQLTPANYGPLLTGRLFYCQYPLSPRYPHITRFPRPD
nr:MAG TPA: hypothetical protein [Bacteriophage sp.]